MDGFCKPNKMYIQFKYVCSYKAPCHYNITMRRNIQFYYCKTSKKVYHNIHSHEAPLAN